MQPKDKALIYNFLGFAVFFLIFRFGFDFLLDASGLIKGILSAVLASVLAPKFGVVRTEEGKKVMMKWLFLKGTREV